MNYIVLNFKSFVFILSHRNSRVMSLKPKFTKLSCETISYYRFDYNSFFLISFVQFCIVCFFVCSFCLLSVECCVNSKSHSSFFFLLNLFKVQQFKTRSCIYILTHLFYAFFSSFIYSPHSASQLSCKYIFILYYLKNSMSWFQLFLCSFLISSYFLF